MKSFKVSCILVGNITNIGEINTTDFMNMCSSLEKISVTSSVNQRAIGW